MTQQNRETLSTLADRAEKATGPDRELDAAIKEAFGHIWDYAADWGPRGKDRPVAKPYTASLDAAMTLVPKGWRWWKAGDSATGGSRMVIVDTDDDGKFMVLGECPCPSTSDRNALALCGASLRAHANLDPTGEKA